MKTLIHDEVTLVPGGVYISVLCRNEYSTQGIEGPWLLESIQYLDGLVVLRIKYIPTNDTASMALSGDTWRREVSYAPREEEEQCLKVQ